MKVVVVVVVMYFPSSSPSFASLFPFAMLPYSLSFGPNRDDVSLDPHDVGVLISAPRVLKMLDFEKLKLQAHRITKLASRAKATMQNKDVIIINIKIITIIIINCEY